MKYLILSFLIASTVYFSYQEPTKALGFIKNCTYTHNGIPYANITVFGGDCPEPPEAPVEQTHAAREGKKAKKHDPSCIIGLASFSEPGL